MTQPDAATSPSQDQNGGPTEPSSSGAEARPAYGAEPGGIGSVLYKLALAGVGALILAQEEIEAAWKRARGEREDGAEAAADVVTGGEAAGAEATSAEGAPGQTDDGAAARPGAPDGTRVWLQIDAAIGRVLRTLPIPTRDEVNEVASKLEALAARIEERSRR